MRAQTVERYIMSIDPGSTGTGIAVWRVSEWDNPEAIPSHTFNIYPNNRADVPYNKRWPLSVDSVISQIDIALHMNRPVRVYSEFPEYFKETKGLAAAGSGNLVKLAFMVGAMGEACRQRHIPVTWIPVREWKGQLPKAVVIKRIQERIPAISSLKVTSHSYDAIGVGLHAKGVRLC